MKPTDNLEETIKKKLNFTASARLHDRMLDDVLNAQEKSKKTKSAATAPSLRRQIMKSPMTKLAAAAIIIIAVVLSISLMVRTTPVAYALGQTIEANHTVRSLYIKDFTPDQEDPKEFWLEFDPQGQTKNIRVHMPEWDSPSDGAKVIVWQEGKATVWFKKKNALLTVRDERFAQQMRGLVLGVDPRLAVERLYETEQRGAVNVEVDEPTAKTELIVVTGTYPLEGPSPGRRIVLYVDPATKLVTTMEFYRLKDNEYQQVGRMEFYDYNQEIDPDMFALDDEVPADAVRVDQTSQEVGLAQGDLSNEEVAAEVARQFFEALITEDYAKAGRLIGGAPAEWVKQQPIGQTKILRIISIGSARPHPNPQTGGVVVPCVVEIEENGEVSEWKLDQLGIRPVYNQAGRWQIFSVPDK